MANIGSIVGGGFGLIRRHPGPVLVWGLISALSGAAIGWAQFRMGAPLDPETLLGRGGSGGTLGRVALGLLLSLLSLVISAVLAAAAFRAVLRPRAGGFAFLRFGSDEWRMIGLTLLLYVLTIAAGIVGTLGVAFLVALARFVAGGDVFAGQALALLLGLAAVAAVVFVLVRLSLVYPLVLVRRGISIDDSWELTRGHFWSLLGAYVLLALISFALIFAVMLPLAGLHVLQATQEGVRLWSDAFRAAGAEGGLPVLLPRLLPVLVASLVVNALLFALWAGALATATREVAGAEDGLQAPEEAGNI